ncbi:MAG: hypothetical protein EZS28_039678 [Streblomastix strix]|uniref:Uncharacterized protein n=1 Tax=Streblomastix strix TaxID=222440 RepID=A0A5J4U577_9EUKA|nr:MAG: hypothetical protein EZS28_039678 [Streblomastix strix]
MHFTICTSFHLFSYQTLTLGQLPLEPLLANGPIAHEINLFSTDHETFLLNAKSSWSPLNKSALNMQPLVEKVAKLLTW